MKLLVVGASGLLGGELVRRARGAGHLVEGAARRARGEATHELDLGDRARVERALELVAPDVVAVCAAWPDVDGCERDPDRSYRQNVETLANLCAASAGAPATIVFYSTDHVFDGSRESHVESDEPRPESVYARHKRAAERLLLARGRSLVVRTSWVFGPEIEGKNFVCRVVRVARARERLVVPAGQAGCPTWSGWLASATLELLSRGMEGVAHVSGAEALSKAAWARLVIDELGLPSCEVVEVPPRAAGQVAPRPALVRLRSERHALAQPPLREILRAERERLLSIGAGA